MHRAHDTYYGKDPHMKSPHQATQRLRSRARRGGLSLFELLIALAIIASLLTATGVALDVSFRAYAIATQSASTQASSRLLTNRLLTNIRNAVAHSPVALTQEEEDLGAVLVAGSDTMIRSPFIGFVDRNGDDIRLQYFDSNTPVPGNDETPGPNELWMRRIVTEGVVETVTLQPVLKGVTSCVFSMERGRDADGIYVLRRATFDFTVEAGDDSSLQIEAGDVPPVRVIASTKPRRI